MQTLTIGTVLHVMSNSLPKSQAKIQEVTVTGVYIHYNPESMQYYTKVEVMAIEDTKVIFGMAKLLEGMDAATRYQEVMEGGKAFYAGETPTQAWSKYRRVGFEIEREIVNLQEKETL